MMRALIMVLAVAMGIQNTCLHGWVGKTAFVACQGAHCPMKEHNPPKPEDQTGAKKDISNVKQTFELNIVKTENTPQITAQTDGSMVIGFPDLKEIFADPLFRPPISPLPV